MTPLTTRMRAYAKANAGRVKTDLLSKMVELADAMDKAVADGRDDRESIKRMIGATARARLHWCKVTGEPLVSEGTIKAGATLISVLSGLARVPRRIR